MNQPNDEGRVEQPSESAARGDSVERLDRVEARLIEQEHRLWAALRNFLARKKWPAGDPRRRACWLALIWVWFGPMTLAVGGGGATLCVLIWQNWLIKEQNTHYRDQLGKMDDQIKAAQRANREAERTQLIGVLWDVKEVGLITKKTVPVASARTRKEALLRFVEIERERFRENGDTESRVDLSGAQLSDIVAPGLDLGNMSQISLKGADLRRADLSQAHLDGVDLSGAHLEGADLGSAQLEGADLKFAHLKRARLSAANLQRASLSGADLEAADLNHANLYWAYLNSANLEAANLLAARLYGADLTAARLYGADLTAARLPLTNLIGADLEGAQLGWAHLEGAIVGEQHPCWLAENDWTTDQIFDWEIDDPEDLPDPWLDEDDLTTDAFEPDLVLRGTRFQIRRREPMPPLGDRP